MKEQSKVALLNLQQALTPDSRQSYPAGAGKQTNSRKAAFAKNKLHDAAQEAAQYLADVAGGRIKNPRSNRIETCKYIIDQVIGKPRQQQEIGRPGEFSYRDILESAAKILDDSGSGDDILPLPTGVPNTFFCIDTKVEREFNESETEEEREPGDTSEELFQ